MTEVAFHFNVPDKLGYACRLLRKAHAAVGQVGVVGPQEMLGALDQALWSFSALDFVPHCLASAPAPVLTATPIVLATDSAQLPPTQVLVNLGAAVPAGFERFEALPGLAWTPSDVSAEARQRWRHYAERGYPIQRHDLAARE